MCIFGISIRDDSICQLRIDFDDFSLDAGSEKNKPCDRDGLELFSGGSSDLGSIYEINLSRSTRYARVSFLLRGKSLSELWVTTFLTDLQLPLFQMSNLSQTSYVGTLIVWIQ